MKKLLVTFATVALYCAAGHAVTIAFWSFNSGTPLTPNEGAGTFVDATGAGTVSYVAGVTYGTYVAGSAISRSSAAWGSAVQSTRFYEMRVNASSLTQLNLRYDGNRSASGPTRVDLYYSTDGGGTYTLHSSMTQPSAWTGFSFAGLSSVSGLNNNSDVRFRLAPSGTTAAAGTLRFDNVLIESIPEPAVMASLFASLFLFLPRMR